MYQHGHNTTRYLLVWSRASSFPTLPVFVLSYAKPHQGLSPYWSISKFWTVNFYIKFEFLHEIKVTCFG